MAKNSKPANPRSNHHHKKSRDPRSLAPSTTHTEPPQTQNPIFLLLKTKPIPHQIFLPLSLSLSLASFTRPNQNHHGRGSLKLTVASDGGSSFSFYFSQSEHSLSDFKHNISSTSSSLFRLVFSKENFNGQNPFFGF